LTLAVSVVLPKVPVNAEIFSVPIVQLTLRVVVPPPDEANVPVSAVEFGQPPEAVHAPPVPPVPRNHLLVSLMFPPGALLKKKHVTACLRRRQEREREKEKAEEFVHGPPVSIDRADGCEMFAHKVSMAPGPERPDAAKGDQRSPDAMDLRLGIRVVRFRANNAGIMRL
jgi:hypothetical protein